MAKVNVYNLAGEKVGDHELGSDVFEASINPVVVQQVVVAQLSNRRAPIAHTKGRSEVRGGGKKPWKQKGTGRARHGSIRSPLWKGGGVTFGPRSTRNFFKKVNKKVRQAAIRMILSDKLSDERILLVDSFEMPEVKTKSVATFLGKLPKKGYRTLIVAPKEAGKFQLSSRNLPDVNVIRAENVNAHDLMKAHTIIMSVDQAKKIEETFSPLIKKAA